MAYKIVAAVLVMFCLNKSFQMVSGTRSDYGEHCNKTTRCKSQGWLTCKNEICECLKPDEMIFDTNKAQCVVIVGERCQLSFSEGDGQEISWTENSNCVENATCSPEGICVCDDGFIENRHIGTCMPVKNLGQSCQFQNECNNRSIPLVCVGGQCHCDSGVSFYMETVPDKPSDFWTSNDYFKCKSGNLIGRYYVCNYNNNCGDNSDEQFCNGRTFVDPALNIVGPSCVGLADRPCINGHCIKNANCDHFTGQCSCSVGHFKTKQNTCSKGHGYSCSSSDPCKSDFTCVNEKCECGSPDFQIYDSVQEVCRGIIGSACNTSEYSEPSQTCIANANCELNEEGKHVCNCKTGYIENESGQCDVKHEGVCNLNTDCDSVEKLVCRNNICSCKNDASVFDEERRKCVIPVGLRCDESNGILCVKGVNCVTKDKRLAGKCQYDLKPKLNPDSVE